MNNSTVRFIDLFGGIGGFRLGLEQASNKFECVDYIEYDKYAVKSYNEIFKEDHEPRDVTKLNTNQIPEHDLICAGFPCQAFSVAGNRQGTDEARGKLFREIVRIAEAHRPEMLLLENVKGILSQKAVQQGEAVEGTKGHAFREVLSTLHELGYCLEWRVLNSKNWGVPQNRERVFIIGHLGGEPRRKVFPLGREDRKDTGQDEERLEIKPCLTPNRVDKRQNGRRFKQDDEPMFTLTGQDIHGVKQEKRIRKLTPKECWRLQGFPDWAFEKAEQVNSDTQLYKQAGNSVTVNVVEALGEAIVENLKSKDFF